MTRIFISYSRADRSFVDEVVPLLRKVYAGASVWYDEAIPGGHHWWHLILSEIAQCDLFIYLLSNESLESPYCQAEFREALRLQKTFLPVTVRPKTQIDDRVPDDLRHMLQLTQYVDLSSGFKDYQATAALYAAINGLLSQRPPTPPAPLTPQPVREPPLLLRERTPARRSPPFWLVLGGGAAVGGLALMVALAVFIAFRGNFNPNSEPTRVRQQSTAELSTPTPWPTMTPGVTPTRIGVLHNDEWTPRVETINGVQMVFVPVGCFLMGSMETTTTAQPVHQVCVEEPFWIDRYEISRGAYRECLIANVCSETPYSSDYDSGQNFPVNRVNWLQTRAYCEWRQARLPTEAEWEFAARGPDSLVFPWGNAFEADKVIYNGSGEPGMQIAEVGSRPGGVSWVGALDMSGSLAEWTVTIYDRERYPYPYSADDGRNDPNNPTSERVLRGGSHAHDAGNVMPAFRYGGKPDEESHSSGFRCVRSE